MTVTFGARVRGADAAAALHGSTRHRCMRAASIVSHGMECLFSVRLGQRGCRCVNRDKTRPSVPKASPKHLGSPDRHSGRQARAAATHLSQQQAVDSDLMESTPLRSAFDTQHSPAP